MPGKKLWNPVRRHFPVNRLNEREEKRRLAHSEENRREHIARPMRTKINPRPGQGRDKQKIEPAPAPEKKAKDQSDRGVVGHVTRGKRRPRAVAVAFPGITDRHFLEEGEKF